MEVTGTKAAFEALINQKGFAKKYGYEKSTVSNWKGRTPTIEKMEEILAACGASIVQEKIYEIPA